MPWLRVAQPRLFRSSPSSLSMEARQFGQSVNDSRGDSPAWRAGFAATLALSMAIGPFAFISISALAPLIVSELGLTRAQLGSVATFVFAAAAASSVLAGRQVDVLGGRAMLLWIFASGSLAAAITSGAQSLSWLWLGSLVAGAGMGATNPVTNQLVLDHISPGHRGLQIGVKQSGVQMAQALIGLSLPPLAALTGWRNSILLGVLLGVCGIVAGRFVVPAGVTTVRTRRRSAKPRLDRTVWWLTAYSFTLGTAVTSVTVYAPLYSFEAVGLSSTLAGATTGVLGAAGVIARILWGRFAERWSSPAIGIAWISVIASASVLLVLGSERLGAWLLWPGLIGLGATALAVNAIIMIAVVVGAGDGRVGRTSGAIGLGMFAGFMTGPYAFGVLVDATGSYSLGWGTVGLLLLLASGISFAWSRQSHSRDAVGDVTPRRNRDGP